MDLNKVVRIFFPKRVNIPAVSYSYKQVCIHKEKEERRKDSQPLL